MELVDQALSIAAYCENPEARVEDVRALSPDGRLRTKATTPIRRRYEYRGREHHEQE